MAATLVYLAERGGEGTIQTFPDALWWAAATITTVGYGDVYPMTPAGRGVAFLLMLVGISVFGLLTARVAAFFVAPAESDARNDADDKLDEILARLERIERNRRLEDRRNSTDSSAPGVDATAPVTTEAPGRRGP
ncbi:MAG: potassium channel family protein [Chloroflexota bacterium]|nr:potassium channel family protein [Chloroflexota bacterium]